MPPEPISTVYFTSSSHQPVCLYVHPPEVARQRLGIQFTAATKTCNIRIIGDVVLCTVHVAFKKSLCIPLPLLGNGSVNTFSSQRKIFRDVALYAAHLVSNESMRLLLSRTSYLDCGTRRSTRCHRDRTTES
jgi:hypothetical protein